jgi:hypothetical protein
MLGILCHFRPCFARKEYTFSERAKRYATLGWPMSQKMSQKTSATFDGRST